jgi:hypothetical protein
VQRSSSTIVCLVGAVTDPRHPALGAHTTYLVVDDDPLGDVADAWTRLFDEAGPIGELEVAVADTIARWRAGSIELPDYYLVTGVDDLAPTRRHWYFGVLHDAAAHRVVPVDPGADAVVGALDSLAPGPWWPPLDRLLDGIEHRAPDFVPAPGSHRGSSGSPPRALGILKPAP